MRVTNPLLCRLAHWRWTLLFLGKQFFLRVFFWNDPDVSFICVFLSLWRLSCSQHRLGIGGTQWQCQCSSHITRLCRPYFLSVQPGQVQRSLQYCLGRRFFMSWTFSHRPKARSQSVSTLQVSSLVFFSGAGRDSAGALLMKWQALASAAHCKYWTMPTTSCSASQIHFTVSSH